MPVIMLFQVACAEPCAMPSAARRRLEEDVVEVLRAKAHLTAAAPDTLRPTGPEASPEPMDVAALLGVDRVVVLDLEASGRKLWVSHFLRGVRGPWTIVPVACEETCPALSSAVLAGLRPRRLEDVDFVGALRAHARAVGECVREEDQVAPVDRIYGKVLMRLEVAPAGKGRLVAVAPPRVANTAFGQCLAAAMARFDVGPFEGEGVQLSLPIDL